MSRLQNKNNLYAILGQFYGTYLQDLSWLLANLGVCVLVERS